MHYPDAIPRMRRSATDVIRELEVGRLLVFSEARDAEKILRFLYDDERRVFKEDLHAGGEDGLRNREAIRANRYGITGDKRVIELRDRTAVHRHGLMLQPGANLFLLNVGPVRKEIREQLRRRVDGGRSHSSAAQRGGRFSRKAATPSTASVDSRAAM